MSPTLGKVCLGHSSASRRGSANCGDTGRSTLIRRTLAKWHYLLCCTPAYLETHSTPRRPADLADHNCLLYAYVIFGPEFPFIDPAGNPVSARVN